MSVIGTAASSANDIPNLLLASSTAPSNADTSNPTAPTGAGPAVGHDRDPATRVDLSDKVKDILARARNDQGVADRFKAFVESLRSDAADASGQTHSSSGQDGSIDVNKAFEQLSGGTPADDGDAPVQVGKSFATGLKADGYTISAIARAGDGSFQLQIIGPDGQGFLDRRFGTSGEFSAASGGSDGVSVQSYQRDNKEYITFSDTEVAATNVTASSDAGTVSATSIGTHTGSVSFVVDFTTGAISMAEAESTSVATNVQIGSPGSTFSTLA